MQELQTTQPVGLNIHLGYKKSNPGNLQLTRPLLFDLTYSTT